MDLSKAERQASGGRRYSQDPQGLNTLLQDILCFFILLSLALLIVASIFCVALNVHHTATQQQSHRDKSAKISRPVPADGLTKLERFWIRFFRCLQKQPRQDAKKEQVREMEQVREPEHDLVPQQRKSVKPRKHKKQQPHFFPTYKPIDYSELAAGDSVNAEATIKESDSRPQPLPVDNF